MRIRIFLLIMLIAIILTGCDDTTTPEKDEDFILAVMVLDTGGQPKAGMTVGRLNSLDLGMVRQLREAGVELTPELPFFAPLSLFSSMFLHGGFLHLAGNMLYLWIFGDNVEDQLGHVKFFIFYILCGLAASLLHIITAPNSKVPMVGASGAIAGVLGAYMIRFPRARILTLIFLGFFIRIVAVPALFVLGFWFILQLLYAFPSIGSTSGGVAWFAHVGGFLAGIVLFKLFSAFSKRRYYYDE